jgi:hypothetical protein
MMKDGTLGSTGNEQALGTALCLFGIVFPLAVCEAAPIFFVLEVALIGKSLAAF